MRKILCLLSLLIPMTLMAADYGVGDISPNNFSEYTYQTALELYVSIDSGDMAPYAFVLCQMIKEYISDKKLDDLEPWVKETDCDIVMSETATKQDIEEVLVACATAAQLITENTRQQATREKKLALAVQTLCYPSSPLRGRIVCEIGDVTRCLNIEDGTLPHVACCIISPRLLDVFEQDEFTMSYSDVERKVFPIEPGGENGLSLADFDMNCQYIQE